MNQQRINPKTINPQTGNPQAGNPQTMSSTTLTSEIKALLPWESNYFEISPGVKLHYFDQGPKDKDCLLLVHGNPTWSFYFRSLIEKFSKNYRVIAADFLGMGLSSKTPANTWRASDRANELESLLNHLGIQKFSLVMHDWGGPIGTRVALNRISQLQKIVYLNTTLTETESLPPFIKLAAKSVLSKLITSTTTQFLHFTTKFGAHKLSSTIKSAYLLPFPNRLARKAVCDFVQDIPFSIDHPTYKDLNDLAKELPLLRKIPILILWGLKDPVFHRGMLKRVASHFPHAKVREFVDASHLILEDKPTEVAAEIEVFIKSGNKAELNSNTEIKEDSKPSLVETFLNNASTNPNATASIEIKTPGLLSVWPISSLLGTDKDRLKYNMLSYSELKARTIQYQRGLISLGMSPGKKIIMLLSPCHDFLAFTYAILACGGVPVFIDSGIGTQKLCECIQKSQAQGVILSSKAQILYLLKRKKIFSGMTIVVNASPVPIGFGANLDFFLNFSAAETQIFKADPNAMAMVAFTSGATGCPKGAIFTNENLAAQLQIFQRHFKLAPEERDLPLLPIFSLYSCALGSAPVFYPISPGKPLDLDPEQVCKAINDLGIRTSFGSPTLWAKIAEFIEVQPTQLSSLRKIFIAGTSVPSKLISILNKVIPGAEIFTPYGATEALPTTLSPARDLPQIPSLASNGMSGIAIGKILPEVELKIIQIVEGPIFEDSQIQELDFLAIGEIIVSGDNISKSYLLNDAANANNKIILSSGQIWHRIGDTGYQDSEGNLYYCGRVAHITKSLLSDTTQEVLFSEPVELVFNNHIKIRRTALIYLSDQRKSALAVEPEPKYFPRSLEEYNSFVCDLRELATSTNFTRNIKDFFFFKSFPVDARHNAKIFRDQLGTLAVTREQDFKLP
jgi:acyl-CoA synthetase (AMP-forming)/AMP-acid ligase II/pimeloyl-ACP methyl ester carboxylesterase